MKRKINLLFVLAFLTLTVSRSFALMGVTEVKITGKKAEIVLDGYLKISGIDVIRRANKIKIKPPIYISKAGKIFPQVEFLASALEERVIAAIKSGKPVGSASEKLSYKVTKMSLYNPQRRSSMKAFSGVSFNNEVAVECKVMYGQKGAWISWPSTKADGGKWDKQVNIIKPDIKKRIEQSVLAKYEKETSYEAKIIPGGKTLPMAVTDVEVTPVESGGATKAIASIVLNNAIKIMEIKVKETSGKTRLKYPEYVSKAGRVYPQVKILDPQLERDIITAINKKESSGNASNEISYKISKYDPFTRGGSSLKVFCAVVFNDKIEIECKIMEKDRGPWISWPARAPSGGGRWINQVEIKDRKLNNVIKDALTKRYKLESGAGGGEDDSEY